MNRSLFNWSLPWLAAGAVALGHLHGCGHPGRGPQSESTGPTGEGAAAPARVEASLTNETLEAQAATFDKFLKGELSNEELGKLKESCNNEPEKNLFCFSILNYSYLDERRKKKAEPGPRPPRVQRIKPQFNRSGAITNFAALKAAPVSATLGAVAQLSKARLESLKKLALAETKCPNLVAISVASALEDHLPSGQHQEIAALYEKGANCLQNDPGDREAMLSRAGLFYFLAKEYKQAFDVFLKASWVQEAVTPRSIYWRYRTEQLLGKRKEAQETLEQLITKYPFSFHTLVAQTARNADPGILLSQPHRQVRRSQAVPTVNLLLEQVEALNRFGFGDSVRTVIDWAVLESDEVEPEVKIYLAELKDEKEDHLSQITLLADVLYDNPHLISKKTMELYFPKPYFPIFEKQAAGLDPFLLLAIARQESAFNPRAVSPANAVGLLQVVPRTGRKLTNATRSSLMTPEMNIKTGAKYVQQLLQKFDGQIHLALAAYNAGPMRVVEWLKRYPTDEPILFVDISPYRETRNYVALVLRNYYWYRRMHGSDADALAASRRALELSPSANR